MQFDPATIPDAWPRSGDFTIPDWEAIGTYIEATLSEPQWHQAYTTLAHYWLEQLCTELGGDYYIAKSPNWLMLTAQPPDDAKSALYVLEQSCTHILQAWDGVASDEGYGPHVALMFDETDDYYDYVGQYYPDEPMDIGASAGMMLDHGFAHIALARSDLGNCLPTLYHELTHLLVTHLPLPLWINEGLAMTCERILTDDKTPLLDERLAHEHRWYWNENNIGLFWNGESFSKPGRSQELSYSLAEILATHLREVKGYRDFILNAHWEDAGEAAARQHLKCGVGDIAAIFLGTGNWGVAWTENQPTPATTE